MVEQATWKTYKFKLKPTAKQERVLESTVTLCRNIYNAALGERKDAWLMRGVTVNYYQQKAELPGIKDAMPEYGEVNAQVLQDVVLRVDRAFQAYVRRIRNGETPGYPRFEGRNRYNSFTYPQVGDHGGAVIDNGFLVLSKVGHIAIHWSRSLDGTPKTVRISREADGWYACISCANVPVQALPPTNQDTGIDLGLEAIATLSDGSRILHPGWYRKAERALKTAQRRDSRRNKGSKRYRKAVAKLAQAHQKVRRQRQDFHHKSALHLVQSNDAINDEDLQTANLVKNHYLAKSISDAGWRAFLTILSFKAVRAGRSAVAAPPAFTSQLCSSCGVLVYKGLSVRWHSCPDCGGSLHRDHNAALNILRLGRQMSGVGQALRR
jgi:putative transposase